METYDHHENNSGPLLEAGQQLALAQQEIKYVEDGDRRVPFLVNAQGAAVSLEHLLGKPVRHKAHPKFVDAVSFIDYVNRFKQDATLIFSTINAQGGSFIAALDIAGKGDTSWNEHAATFKLQVTPDWAFWINGNKQWMSQEDFVHFVDVVGHTFFDPSGASMQELASSIEATIGGNYKSAFKAQNGDRTLVLDMTTVATFGKGEAKIEVPKEITIVVPPFEGQNAYQQKAFLRFRPGKEGVQFQYELQRVDETIRNSAQEARDRIAQETSLPVLNGSL